MNVTVVQKSATERELAIELPAADLEKAFEERLSEARKRIQLPGFRPGKTPKDLIRKRYGASLRGEAIDNLVQQSVRSACVQEKIVPVAPGDLSDFEAPEGGDVKFKVVVEVDPEIELQGYADLKFPVETKELEADEIEKALDSMRQRAAEVKDAERPSQVGDLVGATYKRIEIDGVERPLSAPAFQVEIGKGIPEVDAGLTGIVPGADVTIEFTFPDDYADESSRGKKGLYEVLVEKVLTRVIPELDEALAEKFGFKDLSELRARVETDLKATAERSAREAAWDKAVEAILEANPFEVPKARVQDYVQWQYDRMQKQGAQLPPVKEMQKAWAPEAEKLLKRQRVISWIAEKEEIRATTDEVGARIKEIAGMYGLPEEDIREELKRSGRVSEVREELRGTKTLNWLIGER